MESTCHAEGPQHRRPHPEVGQVEEMFETVGPEDRAGRETPAWRVRNELAATAGPAWGGAVAGQGDRGRAGHRRRGGSEGRRGALEGETPDRAGVVVSGGVGRVQRRPQARGLARRRHRAVPCRTASRPRCRAASTPRSGTNTPGTTRGPTEGLSVLQAASFSALRSSSEFFRKVPRRLRECLRGGLGRGCGWPRAMTPAGVGAPSGPASRRGPSRLSASLRASGLTWPFVEIGPTVSPSRAFMNLREKGSGWTGTYARSTMC